MVDDRKQDPKKDENADPESAKPDKAEAGGAKRSGKGGSVPESGPASETKPEGAPEGPMAKDAKGPATAGDAGGVTGAAGAPDSSKTEPAKADPIKPDSTKPEPTKADAKGAGAAPVSAPKPASTAQPAGKPATKKGGRVGAALWTLVVVLVVAVGGYFTYPYWQPVAQPYIDEYIPEWAKPRTDERFAAFEQRMSSIDDLEQRMSSIDDLEQRMSAINDLEQRIEAVEAVDDRLRSVEALAEEHERLSGQVQALVDRVETLEQAIASVRQTAEAVLTDAGAAGAAGTAGATDAEVQALSARLERLEQQATSLAALDTRLAEVETTVRTPVDMGPVSESAAVLAVGQLREAARGSGAFVAELDSVRAAVVDDAEAADALAALEPLASSGVPTVADLRADFGAAASAVVRAETQLAGDGWVDRAVNRLTSLVTIRRTGDAAITADGSEAAVARAEDHLQAGDLAAAVDAAGRLEGPAAEAAAGWIAQARSRLAVDRAVGQLHRRAVARLAAATAE